LEKIQRYNKNITKSLWILSMTPQEIIKALEKQGITRYRISCDTGITQQSLHNWLKGKKSMKSNSNVDKLNEYYKKLTGGME